MVSASTSTAAASALLAMFLGIGVLEAKGAYGALGLLYRVLWVTFPFGEMIVSPTTRKEKKTKRGDRTGNGFPDLFWLYLKHGE
jgi:hypothetical protein